MTLLRRVPWAQASRNVTLESMRLTKTRDELTAIATKLDRELLVETMQVRVDGCSTRTAARTPKLTLAHAQHFCWLHSRCSEPHTPQRRATLPPTVSREIAHSAVDAQLSRVGEDDADDSEVKESNLNESIAAKQAEKKEVKFKIAQVEQQIKERGRPGRMRSMIALRAYGHCRQFRSSACTASSNRWPRGSCGASSAWLHPVGAGRARSAAYWCRRLGGQ